MINPTDKIYHQLAIEAYANLITEAKQIRMSFAPNTQTHRQISIMSAQKGVHPRTIVEMAIDILFTSIMVKNYE